MPEAVGQGIEPEQEPKITKTFVYIAGPYKGWTHDAKSYEQIDANIARARSAARACAISGLPYFCPHMNSAHFEIMCPTVSPEMWYQMDNIFVDFASAILLVQNWEHSTGAVEEVARAEANGTPIFRLHDDVFNPPQKNYPNFDGLLAHWGLA